MDHVIVNFGDGALDCGYGVASAADAKTECAKTSCTSTRVLRNKVQADDEDCAACAASNRANYVCADREIGDIEAVDDGDVGVFAYFYVGGVFGVFEILDR